MMGEVEKSGRGTPSSLYSSKEKCLMNNFCEVDRRPADNKGERTPCSILTGFLGAGKTSECGPIAIYIFGIVKASRATFGVAQSWA